MKEKIEEIVYILLNTGKLNDTILGLQVAGTFDNKKKTEESIDKIKKRIYRRYLEMIDPELALILNNNDMAIKGITDYVYKSSFWYMDEYGNFHFNGQTLYRTKEGYIIDTIEKQIFARNFETQLNLVKGLIEESEEIFNSVPPLKEGADENLANLIREVLTTDTKELLSIKKLYKKK